MSALIDLLREMLMSRLPLYKNNSKTAAKIQQFGVYADQLKLHIADGDVLSFISAFTTMTDFNVGHCVRRQPTENKADVDQYRTMVIRLWYQIHVKVKAGLVRMQMVVK